MNQNELILARLRHEPQGASPRFWSPWLVNRSWPMPTSPAGEPAASAVPLTNVVFPRYTKDNTTRRAVLIVNHLGSWRSDLQRAGEQLPELGDRSWHVEVFDRQVGNLGRYRRSRVTGNWFQGKHSVHLWGHALLAAQVTP